MGYTYKYLTGNKEFDNWLIQVPKNVRLTLDRIMPLYTKNGEALLYFYSIQATIEQKDVDIS